MPPRSSIVRFLLVAIRSIARTPTGLLILLLLAISLATGTRSVAASRLRFVWTGGVPGASFCFVGAAAAEQPHCHKATAREGGRPKHSPPSLVSRMNILSVRSWGIINKRAVGNDTAQSPKGRDLGNGVMIKDDNVFSDESEPESAHLSANVGDIRRHFVFLVHGWLGNEMEMSYIAGALEKAIPSSPSSGGDDDLAENDAIVVHKVSCNNGKTADGIAAGGTRLADEIIATIKSHLGQSKGEAEGKGEAVANSERVAEDEGEPGLEGEGEDADENENEDEGLVERNENGAELEKSSDEVQHVTFSIVGNSLGGLYARYALSILPSQLGSIVMHPNVFCTTATPHLGVASHTYVPIPRVAERVIGRGMGLTGRDLFRLDPLDGEDRDLIYRMSTEDAFLGPLSKFEKRIAYANAFRTDFQVPTDTAAFLSTLSAYPHRLARTYKEKFVATILHTETHDWRKFDTIFREPSMEHDILTMSTKLDSLGWTKVFIDVRERIPMPSVQLPGMRRRSSRSELNEFVAERRESGAFNETGVLIESRELVTLMNPTERLHFPLGHTVMVANSKSDWYARLNEQGKPVMDMLATELVQDMLRFGRVDDEEDSTTSFDLD